ncbi:MAG: ABC transporter substrate-binding protein [Burkholderiaceae bacterium]|nr:ABC transporter substrate-binding protein [Aquabacterium sp.]NUP84941.1 ABC transporter substrate-binding protein [Burkholderiaceae bacterium]
MTTPGIRAPARAIAGFLLALASLTCAAQGLLLAQVASLRNPASAVNAHGMKVGIQAYFDQVNAQGGVHGQKVLLRHEDDELAAPKMVALAKQLAGDPKVLAFVGFLNSGGLAELAKSNMPGQTGIAMIAPLQGEKAIVGAPNFFPFRSGYTDELRAIMREARQTERKRVVIVSINFAFGPTMGPYAAEAAKAAGVPVAARLTLDGDPAKFEATIDAAVEATANAQADAVVLVAAGRYATGYIRALKSTPAGRAQVYAMSVVLPEDVVKAVGVDAARGMVFAQPMPFPYSAALPLVADYQQTMKKYAANEPLGYASLEGYVGARVAVEALRRAGPNPTRDKIVQALHAFGEFNLGGVYLHYSPRQRSGWGQVELTILGAQGKLIR